MTKWVKPKEETKVIFCDCHSPEHQIILSYWPDDEQIEKMLYIQVHLNSYDNFFKRLWVAIRYTFGHHCNYGHWDEVLVSPEVGKELWTYLSGFLQDKNTSTNAQKSEKLNVSP